MTASGKALSSMGRRQATELGGGPVDERAAAAEVANSQNLPED
eukprot:CAMPEP_0195077832 /NCGR_PEP_ID=MMETSP0448-20130528/20168_1 /TAXON_ID=66468 /ORGANISM="Heterocapsa triquestra, Strain CCMP 448" /LENGTH=42 /DNA_ID= /DNA_START= /DNA_END= /DNA_ORIENTATION=